LLNARMTIVVDKLEERMTGALLAQIFRCVERTV
jgi:hypothetical protein